MHHWTRNSFAVISFEPISFHQRKLTTIHFILSLVIKFCTDSFSPKRIWEKVAGWVSVTSNRIHQKIGIVPLISLTSNISLSCAVQSRKPWQRKENVEFWRSLRIFSSLRTSIKRSSCFVTSDVKALWNCWSHWIVQLNSFFFYLKGILVSNKSQRHWYTRTFTLTSSRSLF